MQSPLRVLHICCWLGLFHPINIEFSSALRPESLAFVGPCLALSLHTKAPSSLETSDVSSTVALITYVFLPPYMREHCAWNPRSQQSRLITLLHIGIKLWHKLWMQYRTDTMVRVRIAYIGESKKERDC